MKFNILYYLENIIALLVHILSDSSSVKATLCDLDGSVFLLIQAWTSRHIFLNSIHLAVCSQVAYLYSRVLTSLPEVKLLVVFMF